MVVHGVWRSMVVHGPCYMVVHGGTLCMVVVGHLQWSHRQIVCGACGYVYTGMAAANSMAMDVALSKRPVVTR